MRSLTLEIPHLPPPLNHWSRKHWAVRARAVRDWAEIVSVYAPRRPRPYFAEPVTVALTFRSPRPRDHDSMQKFVLDGLRGVVVPDDSPRWVTRITVDREKGPALTRVVVTTAEGGTT